MWIFEVDFIALTYFPGGQSVRMPDFYAGLIFEG